MGDNIGRNYGWIGDHALPVPTEADIRHAALVVLGLARGADDAALLLDMLGIDRGVLVSIADGR